VNTLVGIKNTRTGIVSILIIQYAKMISTMGEPTCAQCNRLRRPLAYRWGTGWICRDCFKTAPFGHFRRGGATACGLALNNNPVIGVPTTRVRGEVTCVKCHENC